MLKDDLWHYAFIFLAHFKCGYYYFFTLCLRVLCYICAFHNGIGKADD